MFRRAGEAADANPVCRKLAGILKTSMNNTEITAVEVVTPQPQELLGFSIELPVSNTAEQFPCFEVGGWVLGRDSMAVEIDLLLNDGSVRRVPVIYPRQDVARAFSTPEAQNVGFRAPVSVIGMTPEFHMLLVVRLENGERVQIGRIFGRHRPIASKFEAAMQPLLVTSLGRMGTTWMMRLLSEHPSIAVLRIHPYETRPGKLWMQLLARAFWKDEPLWNEPLSRFGELDASGAASDERWFLSQLIERVATSCQRSVEECYREIAEARNQPLPAYFAEKHIPDEVPGITWELYSKAREIVVVRDFRDMLCSIRAFNSKRGSIGFNRDQVASEEEYIRRLGREAQRLWRSWSARRQQAHLVRYEELIDRPRETLQGILAYLKLDAAPSAAEELLQRAMVDTTELAGHRTASTAQESIGRWRRDLDPATQLLCREVFGESLEQFGYKLDA